MRILGAISCGLLFVGVLAAQRPFLRGSAGSVVYPGGTTALRGITRATPSVVNPGGGGVHLVVPGQNRRAGAGYANGVLGYPIYVGGYSDYDPSYAAPPADSQQPPPAPPAQPVTIVMAPQDQTPVPVIINNYYSGASTDHPAAQAPPAAPGAQPPAQANAPAEEPATYLIAYKDHTIYAALAYWVDGDTLHFFTQGNTHNQVSLSLVDRELTARLNKEAGLSVNLPAPSK